VDTREPIAPQHPGGMSIAAAGSGRSTEVQVHCCLHYAAEIEFKGHLSQWAPASVALIGSAPQKASYQALPCSLVHNPDGQYLD
jgi:hypothetical protein